MSELNREDTELAEQVRISIRLSPQAKKAIDRIQELGDFNTIQEVIRRAISDELFLLEQRNLGWNVLLEKDNHIRQIQWP